MEPPLFFVDRDGTNSDAEEPSHLDPVNVRIASDPMPEGHDAMAAATTSRATRKAAWVDEDDMHHAVDIRTLKRRRKLRRKLGETHVTGAEYSQRVREMYNKKQKEASKGPGLWAQLPSEKKKKHASDHSDDEGASDSEAEKEEEDAAVRDLLQSTRKMVSRQRKKDGTLVAHEVAPLRAGMLGIRSVLNANQEDPNQSEARCVEFHPSGRLLLTAGLDMTLRIFQVDGERNAKVQGVYLKGFPIHTAKFTGEGTQVVMAGRRRFLQQLDLNSGAISKVHTLQGHTERSWERFEVSGDGRRLAFLGQEGKVVVLENDTKREIGQLRMNGRVAAVAFAGRGGNENHLYGASEDGVVYLWDLRRMRCVDQHRDEGAIHSTSIAASGTHYALGSDSGVVNVYGVGTMKGGGAGGKLRAVRTEKPEKSFLNLTTQIDEVRFNHDGRLMAFSSHDKKNAARIAHTPSMTVYSNWPSNRFNVRRACCMRFSPNGGYFALGNDKGDVHLLRLSSYATA
eukprot:GFKZ01003745.1.p1 GENE.GFKZ01003745.1~~GFKZ01003745.1.p1  ORF type:complete len:548 (+),score=77.68 GFKZ01003745.1:113-1645(+)